MSGGSYNYACFIEGIDDLRSKREDLRRMVDDLYELGAEDVAADLDSLLALADSVDRRIQARVQRLWDVMHALEWWKSGDYSEGQFRDAVHDYRGEPDQKPSR